MEGEQDDPLLGHETTSRAYLERRTLSHTDQHVDVNGGNISDLLTNPLISLTNPEVTERVSNMELTF